MADTHIRNVAEALLIGGGTGSVASQNDGLTSINSQYYEGPGGSVSHSLSSLDRVVGEDVLLGGRQEGRMSVIRRFFCLFALFDLLFTSLTWFISVVIVGHDDIIKTLREQVVYYNIKYSSFDIVMASASRFTVLLLFYGVLYLHSRIFVALTTAGTCAFIICKVIYYDWGTASQPVFQVIIILGTFVVTWSEVWFLDCRVLPQELNASQYLVQNNIQNNRLVHPLLNPQMENPILRNFLHRIPRHDDMTESVGNFYSPMESPSHSDDEEDENNALLESPAALKRKGSETLAASWTLLNSPTWRLERETKTNETVYSKVSPTHGKIFKLQTVIDVAPKPLLDELFYNVENMISWNKAVCISKRLHVISDDTDITYQVSAPAVNGMIGSRDFVNLRHRGVVEDCLIISAISISCPSAPPTKHFTRGENGPCCWVARPLPNDPNSSIFEFLINTNLKGWIPQSVIDNALAGTLLQYSTALKTYAKVLHKTTPH